MRGTDVTVGVRLRVSSRTGEEACRVLAYMAQECDTTSLQSVAAHVGRHPNTVRALVRDALDMTFAEALGEMRMQRAAGLLDVGVDVGQVARLCGYEHPERFRAAFERRWGASPEAWADEAREGGVA